MTTDPIELWASPDSRSRVERKFFDETFRPFYRTEQVIIHAKGLETVSNSKHAVLKHAAKFECQKTCVKVLNSQNFVTKTVGKRAL